MRNSSAGWFRFLVALALAGVCVVLPASSASAAPVFKAPFPCGQAWTASSYAGHSTNGYAVDFNRYPGQSDLGQPALASAPGTASNIWDTQGGGNLVMINHGGGWVTWYAHLATVSFTNPIEAGEQIGTVGDTGSASSAPHLHYEQRLNGQAQRVAFDGQLIAVGSSYTASDPTHTSTNCGAASSPLADGQFISYAGNVYRIAGGAPIYVSTWDHMGGPQATTPVSQAQFDSLRRYPADGTLISGQAPGHPEHGTVFRIAGGAPVYVSDFAHIGGGAGTIPVDLSAIHMAGTSGVWDHLRWFPADGTLISGQAPGHPEHGTVFRIAGGAPVYVSDFAHIGGGAGTVPVDLTAIHMAGNGNVWSHLRWFPADGTLISGQSPGDPESGSVYRIAGGAPVYVSDYAHIGGDAGTTPVDLTAVHKAGQGGVWDHLRYRPAEGTVISGLQPGDPEHGTLYRIAGGAPVHVSSWASIGGTPGPDVGVDLAAIRYAESGGPWNHLRYRPADGTLLTAGTVTYRVTSGAPYPVTDPADGIGTDPAAIANAGGPGRWSHLSAPSAPPTPTPPTSPPSTGVAPTTTAPPPATTPTSQPAQRTVRLRSVSRAGRLRVEVGPASATEDYRFIVQKRVRGTWRKVLRSSTRGDRDVRVLNLRRGKYRVVLAAYDGVPQVVSPGVRLKR